MSFRDNGSTAQRPGRTLSASDRAPDEGRRVTKEEYFAKWYENPYPDIDVSYEWNNGILEAKPLPNRPQWTSITGSLSFCIATL